VVGLGNPLAGPSAVDAVVAGCVYINPLYDKPVKERYHSQHPYLADAVGPPHVCRSENKAETGDTPPPFPPYPLLYMLPLRFFVKRMKSGTDLK
jgi:hypothetical protein